jgi:hypothetical protein
MFHCMGVALHSATAFVSIDVKCFKRMTNVVSDVSALDQLIPVALAK